MKPLYSTLRPNVLNLEYFWLLKKDMENCGEKVNYAQLIIYEQNTITALLGIKHDLMAKNTV